jgi:hypothetical protein
LGRDIFPRVKRQEVYTPRRLKNAGPPLRIGLRFSWATIVIQQRTQTPTGVWRARKVLVLLLFGLGLGTEALADRGEGSASVTKRRWFLTVYGGPHAQKTLADVLSFQASFPDDTYVGVVSLGRELWRHKAWVGIEAEGQIGKHFGNMDHWEFNGLLALRWHPFFWDKYVDTSFAVGNGLSYATQVPEIESEDDENAGRLLYYLLFELTFGLPQSPQWDLALRIHHRSDVYGLFNGGGSNFVCGGIKYSF